MLRTLLLVAVGCAAAFVVALSDVAYVGGVSAAAVAAGVAASIAVAASIVTGIVATTVTM